MQPIVVYFISFLFFFKCLRSPFKKPNTSLNISSPLIFLYLFISGQAWE